MTMKTPEQMAEEYASEYVTDPGYILSKSGFLAGYQAASEKYEAKITELKANFTFCCEDKARLLQELAAKDEFADTSKEQHLK